MKQGGAFVALVVLAGVLACSNDAGSGGGGRGDSQSIEVYDYKPHYACSDAGQNNAILWIESVLSGADGNAPPDFFAISQLEKQSVDLPQDFESLGAFCDHAGSERYADVIGLFYDASRWTLTDSFPTDAAGNACPLPDDSPLPATCVQGESTPCCACAGDPAAIAVPGAGKNGDRAFAIGRFEDQAGNELCVVTANLPHPVDPDGKRGCDTQTPIDCVPNADGTGFFGTENFIDQLTLLCGDVQRTIFLGDTNATNPNWALTQMFPVGAMSQMVESDSEHYTCCFDPNPEPPTEAPAVNRYPTDRIGVQGALSILTTGGTDSPGVVMRSPTVYEFDACPLASPAKSFGFPCCGSDEEHAPMRSIIDFGFEFDAESAGSGARTLRPLGF